MAEFTRRDFLKRSAFAGAAVLAGSGLLQYCSGDEMSLADGNTEGVISKLRMTGELPNIIIIFADDLGYGDLGCFGSRAIKTPNIDSMAAQGTKFTNFYACSPICTPSRIGLLTGRYPIRTGLDWPLHPEKSSVLGKVMRRAGHLFSKAGFIDMDYESRERGIPSDEITIPEALKLRGYSTGMVGKWHLGDYTELPEYHPLKHGFDFYFGTPFSNDMKPFPLYRNNDLLESNVNDQSKLTGSYTREAVQFIEKSKDKPFFLYIAHTFPHQPLFASERFKGRSKGGRFGDAVEEVDWSVGRILECLKKNGLDRKTLVVFTSDNGPWYNGSPGELRGRKGQSYEGGYRVPLIANYPGKISPGSVNPAPAMNIDFFPTALSLAGLSLPADRVIDGKDMSGLLFGKSRETPHDALYFYHFNKIEAVRRGKWKYYGNINTYTWPVPMDRMLKERNLYPNLGFKEMLFDVVQDPGENYNLIDDNRGIADEMKNLIAKFNNEIKNNIKGVIKK